jgi:hypothetical protein
MSLSAILQRPRRPPSDLLFVWRETAFTHLYLPGLGKEP